VDVDGSGFRLSSAANGVWFDFFDAGTRMKIVLDGKELH
jgi:hypothetical protein